MRDYFEQMNDVNVQVNQGEDQDGLVATPPTVSDDGADEGHGVDPESIKGPDSKGFLLAHAKSTSDATGTVVLWNGTGSRARG